MAGKFKRIGGATVALDQIVGVETIGDGVTVLHLAGGGVIQLPNVAFDGKVFTWTDGEGAHRVTFPGGKATTAAGEAEGE